MKGLQLIARRAILATLKSSPLTALVKPAQIHGQTPLVTVEWPFTKLGRPQTLPIKATCLDGGDVTFPLSGFAGPRWRDAVKKTGLLETAENHASRLGAAIETALDDRGADLTVNGKPVRITFRILDMSLQQDGAEADAYQYSCNVRCRIIAE